MKQIAVILWLCLLPCLTAGQNWTCKPLATQSQLPVANIYTVFQSHDGYFWYGTIGGGLCRDNGYQIHIFKPSDIVNIPKANNILCINEDSKGNIWIGTDVGLFILDRSCMTLTSQHHLQGMVLAITKDCSKNLWVAMDSLVYLFSPDGTTLKSIYKELPSWRVNGFFEDSRNNFFLLMAQKLAKRTKAGGFKEVSLNQPIDPIAMAEDASGGLWIATWNKGVVYFDAKTDEIIEQPVTQTSRDKARCLSILINHHYGLMWVTTFDNLYVYRINGRHLEPYDTSGFMAGGNRILALLHEDSEGNIWVPGFIPNTFIISPNKGKIKRIAVDEMRTITGYPLIPDRMVMREKEFWIHQGRMGLSHYDVSTRQISIEKGRKYSTCIESNQTGDGIWAAEEGKLSLLEYNNGFRDIPIVHLPEEITHITDLGTGSLFIGTKKGVYEYSQVGRSVKKLCPSEGDVIDMALSGNQLYFIAKLKGLFCVSLDQKNLVPTKICDSPYLSALATNIDGTLWAVGENGKVYDIKRHTISLDTFMSSNNSEAFIDVTCDKRGHVWILSNQCAREYNPFTHAFRTFRNADNQINVAYFFHLEEARDDSMGIGGAGAMCIIPSSPDLDMPSASQLKPRITAYKVGDSTIVVNDSISTIEIPCSQNTVSLYLSTLDIFNADKICFAYRIDGINRDWIYLPQNVNTLYVNNLSTGNYRIHLRATDGSGCWQEGETIVRLHRMPLWWQTWWAILLFVIITAIPLYCLWMIGARVRKLHQIQRQRKDLELREIAVPSQQELIEEKEKEFLALAKNYVEQHIADPEYSVVSLASDLCMSRSNLHRRLQPLTGLSPVEFIRDIRLKHAASMLSAGLAVTEVSKRVGFATPSYFTKCFKEHFGMLPTEYGNSKNVARQ